MSICDSIKKKYIRLSKGQRKVAQFVIDNPNVIATQVASEVGRQAGVSESTVIRFCYAIDLSGFSELQQEVKNYLIEKDGVAPVKARPKKATAPAYNVMAQDVAVLEGTMQNLENAVVEQAILHLHSAQQIYILGVRSSASAAFWLYSNLRVYRDKVDLMVYDEQKIAADLMNMNAQTVLFVVGVTEQQEDVMAIVDIAKRKDVKIMAITDSVPCPLQEKADVLFTISTRSQVVAACDVAVISLLHALVTCMVEQYKEYYAETRYTNTQDITNGLQQLLI